MTSGQRSQPDPAQRAMLLTALYVAQEQNGYLTREAMERVAGRLGLTDVQVEETASFYSMFHTTPVGRYTIQLCEGLSCHLAGGAEELLEHVSRRLGITPGDTTPDGMFTLLAVQCLAACGSSPAMRVNDTLYTHLTTDDLDTILDELGKTP
ncbi:MAG: NADH-quinone oxidoreductase subunit NuoE [Anaerolineae bacterium]